MNEKQITIGGVLVSIAVSGTILLTGGQVSMEHHAGFEAVFESVSDCEIVRDSIQEKIVAKNLTFDEARISVLMEKNNCSLLSSSLNEESKQEARKIILDNDNEKFYYDYSDYVINR